MEALQKCRWHEFDSRIALEQAARRFILEAAERAIAARGAFLVVLAGGHTPRNVYQGLSIADADWPVWHIYFGDERCLPADDPERNSRGARTVWLDHVAIPSRQIHSIPAELGPETAAASYALDIAAVGKFDLVLLGLGEDGHTASLFSGKDWGEGQGAPLVLAVHDAPKPPADRVTLSAGRLSEARSVLFLVTGKSKREAVDRLMAGERIPAGSIRPETGIDIYTDLHLARENADTQHRCTHN